MEGINHRTFEAVVGLPSELITIISLLCESAADVLSLALTCKRYFRIILANIKEKNNKASNKLLSLHTRKAIELDKISPAFHPHTKRLKVHYRLPNRLTHGAVEEWIIRPGNRCAPLLPSLEQDDIRVDKLAYTDEYRGVIFQTEALSNAHQIIRQYGQIASRSFRYFGMCDGKRIEYDPYNVDSTTWTTPDGSILREENYINGVYQDGLTRRSNGKVRTSVRSVDDHMESFKYDYFDSSNIAQIRVSHYKDGVPTGRQETYQNSMLVDRTQAIDEHTLVTEMWDPDSGIRKYHAFKLAYTQKHGNETCWSGRTGTKVAVTSWINNKMDGPTVEWDEETGARTSEGNYIKGSKNGLFESWHTNGTRIQSRSWKNDLPSGTAEQWDEWTGIRTSLSVWDQDGDWNSVTAFYWNSVTAQKELNAKPIKKCEDRRGPLVVMNNLRSWSSTTHKK